MGFYRPFHEEWLKVKDKKPAMFGNSGKMTVDQLHQIVKNLFIKHDVDYTGGIEMGKEFDGFLFDLLPYIGENSDMPRDELRKTFGMQETFSSFDLN